MHTPIVLAMFTRHVNRVLDMFVSFIFQLTLHSNNVRDHIAALTATAVQINAKVVVFGRMVGCEQEYEILAVPERGREDHSPTEHVLMFDACVKCE